MERNQLGGQQIIYCKNVRERGSLVLFGLESFLLDQRRAAEPVSAHQRW
jgi:hypothetical protein